MTNPTCPTPGKFAWIAALTALASVGGVAISAAPASDDLRLTGSWYAIANADDVAAIAEDGDELWVASTGGGVARWSKEGHLVRQYLAPQDGLRCNDVRDVTRWRGVWWFATCEGLAMYDPGRGRIESLTLAIPSADVTGLAVDEADRLWLTARPYWDPSAQREGADQAGDWRGGGAAYTQDGLNWTQAGDAAGWPSRNLTDVALWRGEMWVAGQPHAVWRPPAPDPGGGTREGRWETVGGGVARFGSDQAWVRYDSHVDSTLPDSATVLAPGQSVLWVGTNGRGLMAFDGNRWVAHRDCGDPFRCISDNHVTAVAEGPDGAVWVATARFNGRGTGLAVLDHRGTYMDPSDDAWKVYQGQDGLPGLRIDALLPTRDSTVWMGTAELDANERRFGTGLTRLMGDRQSLRRYSVMDQPGSAPPDNVITATAWDGDSRTLWVGTDRGGLAARDEDGTWRHFTRESTGGGLGSNSIADLLVGPDGALWVATREVTYDSRVGRWTDGGLSRFHAGGWSRLTRDQGLPSNNLSALALDQRGKLWVGSGDTVFGAKEHRYRGAGVGVVDAASMTWERTHSFPVLTSNNVTDIVVAGGEVWVATAYFFYVDSRPGGAQLNVGGGLSVYTEASGQWRKLGMDEGLTPAVRSRSGGTGPLLDFRSLHISRDGRAVAGASAYPAAVYVADVVPDAVLDVIAGGSAVSTRWPGGGAVTGLAEDGGGNLWVATAASGLRIRVGDQWLEQSVARGNLPSNALTTLTLADGQVWLGSDGGGLSRLVPPPPPTPEPTGAATAATALPFPTPAIIQRFPEKVFLPRALREFRPYTIEE